jgi:hypothetical protein
MNDSTEKSEWENKGKFDYRPILDQEKELAGRYFQSRNFEDTIKAGPSKLPPGKSKRPIAVASLLSATVIITILLLVRPSPLSPPSMDQVIASIRQALLQPGEKSITSDNLLRAEEKISNDPDQWEINQAKEKTNTRKTDTDFRRALEEILGGFPKVTPQTSPRPSRDRRRMLLKELKESGKSEGFTGFFSSILDYYKEI